MLRYPGTVIFASIVGLFFLGAGWLAIQFPADHRTVPLLIIVPGVALSLLVLVAEYRRLGAGDEGAEARSSGSSWRSDAVRFGWLGGFVLSVAVLGFHLGSPIAVAAYAWRSGERPLTAILLAAVAIGVVLVFETQFQLRFPRGLLF